MQDVEIYIGDSTALSGTITYQAGNNLTDSTKNFFSNPEIVGNIIVNNTNGKRATVTGIYGDQTIILDVAIADFGANTNSYSILQNQELLDTFKVTTMHLAAKEATKLVLEQNNLQLFMPPKMLRMKDLLKHLS